MYKAILVPLDGSELSKSALPHACELTKAFNAHLILLFVVEPPSRAYYWATEPYGLMAAESAAEWEEKKELDMAEQFLRQTVDELKAQGVEAEYKIVEGDPGSEICDCAQALEADLIVMSTHGRSGIQRWVYGSVAEKVLRGAETPVLLVRAHRQTV